MRELLKGKSALVTGAGRNIGRSIAIELAKAGADVYFTDNHEQRLSIVERELRQHCQQVQGFLADVSDSGATDRLLKELKEQKVDVDVLVNNVGVDAETKVAERSFTAKVFSKISSTKSLTRLNTWKEVYETNLFGPLYLTDRIAEEMIKTGNPGSIIFITSIHQCVLRGDAAYSSSKAALGMLVRELALALADHSIRVNGIAPGRVVEGDSDRDRPHRFTPLHKTAVNPDYIGRSVVYLAADYYSKHTTGTVIKIDGGLSLHNYMTPVRN